jgi:hypothetical protein
VAELFHADVPRSVRARQVDLDKLPGVGELDRLSRARLLLELVDADLRHVWRSPPLRGTYQRKGWALATLMDSFHLRRVWPDRDADLPHRRFRITSPVVCTAR